MRAATRRLPAGAMGCTNLAGVDVADEVSRVGAHLPSPLWGRWRRSRRMGVGGQCWCSDVRLSGFCSPATPSSKFCTTPTPDPSPQGGGRPAATFTGGRERLISVNPIAPQGRSTARSAGGWGRKGSGQRPFAPSGPLRVPPPAGRFRDPTRALNAPRTPPASGPRRPSCAGARRHRGRGGRRRSSRRRPPRQSCARAPPPPWRCRRWR